VARGCPYLILVCPGAAHGKGRGREVIAVAKSSDLVMMVLDASKEEGNNHRCVGAGTFTGSQTAGPSRALPCSPRAPPLCLFPQGHP
jgi:hypothetical protein